MDYRAGMPAKPVPYLPYLGFHPLCESDQAIGHMAAGFLEQHEPRIGVYLLVEPGGVGLQRHPVEALQLWAVPPASLEPGQEAGGQPSLGDGAAGQAIPQAGVGQVFHE